MDFQKQLNESQENARLSFFQNPGYQFERREKKNLLIDHKIGTTITDITLPLFEPLKIDKLSDVFIESFTLSIFVTLTAANSLPIPRIPALP